MVLIFLLGIFLLSSSYVCSQVLILLGVILYKRFFIEWAEEWDLFGIVNKGIGINQETYKQSELDMVRSSLP